MLRGLITRPRSIRDAAIHNGQASTRPFDLCVQIWPDLSLQNYHQRRTNDAKSTADAGYIIEGCVEDSTGNGAEMARRCFAPGDRGRGDINRNLWLRGMQLIDQRYYRCDFADRNRVQPNAAVARPSEAGRKEAETLRKVAPVARVPQESEAKVDKGQG
jgi:hypothetical protein